jgi:hypothetical protein
MKPWLLCLVTVPLIANAAPPLNCDVGPVAKVFGSVPWLVYSCNDASSVVLVSAPGSPAMPFYFAFSLEGSAYTLRGEGTGAKAATDAALKELQALSASDVLALRHETLVVKKP